MIQKQISPGRDERNVIVLVLRMDRAFLAALVICVLSAVAEMLCAGRGLMDYFDSLKWPRYSLPLWAWGIIGAFYYVLCFVLLLRLFRFEPHSSVRTAAIVALLLVMIVNALFNYFFFRRRDLFASWLIFLPYNVVALALFACLLKIDNLSAVIFAPYLVYLIYANAWMYRLGQMNR